MPPTQQKRWQHVFTGGPQGGCHGIALDMIYGSRSRLGADSKATDDFFNYLIYHAVTFRTIRTRDRAWAACMTRATASYFTYRSIFDPKTGAHANPETGMIDVLAANSPSLLRTAAFQTLERKIAAADTGCAYSVGQPSPQVRVFQFEANHLPASLTQEVKQFLTDETKAVARARQILSALKTRR